jgi:hypothetical protein
MRLAKVGALIATVAASTVAIAARMRRVFIPHGIVRRVVSELAQINAKSNRFLLR